MKDEPRLTPRDPDTRCWSDPALAGAWLMDAHYHAHQFERHLHDEMVIVVTEGGSGEVQTRLGIERSSAGTVWVFAAGEYHGGRVMPDQTWTYRAMYLDDAALRSLAAVHADSDARPLFVPPGLYRDPHLARLLSLAHRLHETNAPLMERQARWWAAMEQLFARHGRPRLRAPDVRRESAKMARVRDFIADNFRRDVSIDELGHFVGLSRYHLIRSFKREFGLPPHGYANQLRLIEAKRLLREGLLPAQVAAEVGYYDQSHLTRMFKRAYDLTPGVYAGLELP